MDALIYSELQLWRLRRAQCSVLNASGIDKKKKKKILVQVTALTNSGKLAFHFCGFEPGPDPEVINCFHVILNAHKYKNFKKFGFFLDSDKPRMLFPPPVHKCQSANNCWHFNIYKQENFHAQLS